MDEDTQPLEGELVETVNPDAIELGRNDRPGRPTSMTPNVVGKLIFAFANGFNITEACQYAEIDRSTYYDWLAKDDRFSYKMSEAQSTVGKRAKIIVSQAINAGDVGTARWYLNARDPDFKAKAELGPPEGQATTEQKLKEFMDDTDDGAYPDPANAGGEQSAAEVSPESGDEVAPGPSDIS
jgi:hypothetical protein